MNRLNAFNNKGIALLFTLFRERKRKYSLSWES